MPSNCKITLVFQRISIKFSKVFQPHNIMIVKHVVVVIVVLCKSWIILNNIDAEVEVQHISIWKQ